MLSQRILPIDEGAAPRARSSLTMMEPRLPEAPWTRVRDRDILMRGAPSTVGREKRINGD